MREFFTKRINWGEKYKEEFVNGINNLKQKPEEEWCKNEKILQHEDKLVMLLSRGFKINNTKKWKDVKESDIEKCILKLKKRDTEKTVRAWIKNNTKKSEKKIYNEALGALVGKFVLEVTNKKTENSKKKES
jgi:hypothetical protein